MIRCLPVEGEGKRLGGIDNKVIRMYIYKGEAIKPHLENSNNYFY